MINAFIVSVFPKTMLSINNFFNSHTFFVS
jgi:hypothetical protein